MQILVTGSNGMLGQDLVAHLQGRHGIIPVDLPEVDITDPQAIEGVMGTTRPEVVIHTAAFTAVDECESRRDFAFQVNAEGTRNVAAACRMYRIPLLYISTDYVFDGEKPEPYLEGDPPRPINVYGHSKLEGEKHVSALVEEFWIVRTSWLFGPVPSVILECGEKTAEALIAYAPKNHFVIHTSPNLLPIVKKKFPDAKSYIENWMLARRENVKFISSKLVRRLSTKKDAAMFAKLVLNRKDRPKRNLKRYVDWITKMPIYGLFKEDELVSYAGSFIQTPQIWMIGGVYTDPAHRNKGFALLATSAVTQEALKKAEMAALFVRSDNYAAIRVYEKIGYQKIGEKLWVDVGTGLKP